MGLSSSVDANLNYFCGFEMFSGVPRLPAQPSFPLGGRGGGRWRVTEWWWPPGRRGRAVPHHLTVCSGLGGSVCGHTQACRAAVRVGAGSHVRLSLRFQQGQRAERAQACPAQGCFCWRARAASTGLPFCPWGRAEPPTPARPRLTCVSASRWGSMVSHDRCRSWQWQRWFPRIGRQLCLHTRLPAAVTGNEAAQKPGRGRAGGRRAPRAPWRCAGPWSPVRTGLWRGLCPESPAAPP